MSGHRGDELAVNSSLASDRSTEDDTVEGIVIAGSWNPVTATIQVVVGDTYAIANDGGGDQFDVRTATIATTYNDQYGPVGGERVFLVRVGGGYIAHFEHADDDTLGAPAGERWIVHRNKSGVIDSYIKLTNDGSAVGDDKGGLKLGFGELAEIETLGGHSVVLDDAAKKITITSTGGLKIVLDDNTGKVEINSAGASTDAMMNATQVKAALTAFKAAMVAAAVPNAGAIVVPTLTGSTTNFAS